MSNRAPLSLLDHNRLHAVEAIRLPPHSIECEQSVLGSVMLDALAWDKVGDLITEADFYRADHRLIWRHISALVQASKPADAVALMERMESTGDLDAVGGLAYLGSLAMNTPTAANVRHYAQVVRDRAILRRLASACMDGAELAYMPEGRAAADVVDRVQALIFDVTESAHRSGGFVEMNPIMTNVAQTVDALYHRDGMDDLLGVPSGFADLDRLTAGFGPGDLIILAARPSMGKTAMALNIATHVALHAQLPVGIFSMEMPKEALGLRMVCAEARLNFHLIRKGRVKDDEWPKFSQAVAQLNAAPIQIDETGAISPTEIRARARRLHRQYGKLGLLVVDYLQLMGVSGLGDTRAGEIGVATRSLKALAKELNCPILALSQVNRGVEGRPNKRPNMSDLRESGDIEQDADVVIFLYRDEVYRDDSPEKGIAEAIIAKQRNGPIAMVKLTWQGEYMRFTNYADGRRF